MLFATICWSIIDSILKSRDNFANKGPSSKSYGFSSRCVWMWELDHKERCVLKNWCFWTVVLGKTLEDPLNCKEIKPVNPKGNQSWIFIGRTDAEAEVPIPWPPDEKSQVIRKDWCWIWNSDTLATWCKELTHWKRSWCWERLKAGGERGDRGWDGWMASPTRWTWVWVNSGSWCQKGGLGCCDSWSCKESDTTEQLNWTESSFCSRWPSG